MHIRCAGLRHTCMHLIFALHYIKFHYPHIFLVCVYIQYIFATAVHVLLLFLDPVTAVLPCCSGPQLDGADAAFNPGTFPDRGHLVDLMQRHLGRPCVTIGFLWPAWGAGWAYHGLLWALECQLPKGSGCGPRPMSSW